jgi:hypothetical protein
MYNQFGLGDMMPIFAGCDIFALRWLATYTTGTTWFYSVALRHVLGFRESIQTGLLQTGKADGPYLDFAFPAVDTRLQRSHP